MARELPYTHKLQEPVMQGSEQIVELVFSRKPVAGDLRGIRLAELDKADHIITLIGRLTGQPPSVINALETADFVACGEFVLDFFPTGRRTGS